MSTDDPNQPIAWTLHRAAQEFGLHRATLKKRLLVAGIEYDEAGTYTTAQICAAIYGDAQAARTRLANEQADKVALENAEARKILIPVSDAIKLAERFCSAIRSKIVSSSMPETEKRKILNEIKRLEEIDPTSERGLADDE